MNKQARQELEEIEAIERELARKKLYDKKSNAKSQRVYFNSKCQKEYAHLMSQDKISEYVVGLIRRDMEGETTIGKDTVALMKEVLTSLKNGQYVPANNDSNNEVKTITAEEANALLNMF